MMEHNATPVKAKPESLTLSAPPTTNCPETPSNLNVATDPNPNPNPYYPPLQKAFSADVGRGKRPSTPLPDISVDVPRMESRRLHPVKSSERPATPNSNEATSNLLAPPEGPSRYASCDAIH
jgi:hypothetical protein